MWFSITMYLFAIFIPLTMLIGGYCMYHNPPKKINNLFGYRTSMSKKNADTWKFAHQYCGKLWMKLGILLLLATIAAMIPFTHSDDDTIGIVEPIVTAVQVAVLLISIVPVEKALKKTFDENGVRR